MAGYGLRLILIGQSIAQFEAQDSYGKDDTRSLVANSALQIVFPPKEPKDAKEVSETLGYLTESTASYSRGRGIFNSRSGDSVNVSDQKRALMMPQELRTMSQDKQIVFMEYTKPILCEKIRYYDDQMFIPRVLPPAYVPSMDIARYQSGLRKMVRELTVADVDLEKKSLKRTSDRDQLEVMTQAPPNRRITPKDASKELVPFSQFYAKTAGINFEDLRSMPSTVSRKASLDESRKILDGENLGQGTVLQDFLALIDGGQDASLISLAKRGVSAFEADAAFDGV
ncbi:type IV secretory system conjugative DNA transfer family protein [Polynucleobacter sp. JS-Safj-400b-B2]|nr:type IV secretory system conjugative DNA transfer family protein [Polynucleobacter sp. JS-Safj-400b-B2]